MPLTAERVPPQQPPLERAVRAGEAAAYSLVQRYQRPRPSGAPCLSGDSALRDHGAPFFAPPEGYLGYELSDAVGIVFETQLKEQLTSSYCVQDAWC